MSETTPQLPAPQQTQSVGAQLAQALAPQNQVAASVQIEAQRAAVQVASQVMAAQSMPRDELSIRARLLEKCQDAHFADTAFYAVERGEDVARGASVHLAKEVARLWGHLNYSVVDHGERRSTDGERFSDLEVMVWDIQQNSRYEKRLSVKWWQHTKKGGYAITDPNRAREIVGAIQSKELRNGILNFVPKSLINELKAACDATLARYHGTKEKLTQMLAAFRDDHGVKQSQIETYIGKPVGSFEPIDIANLRRVYSAIKSAEATVEEFFGETEAPPPKAADKPADKPAQAKQIAKPAAAKSKPAAPKPEPKPEPTPEPAATEAEEEAPAEPEQKQEAASEEDLGDAWE